MIAMESWSNADTAVRWSPIRAALYVCAAGARTTTPPGEEYRLWPEIQEERLRRLCGVRGWQVAAVYRDGPTGRKEPRPGVTRLMNDAHGRPFDVVTVAALDLFADSFAHLVMALDDLRRLNIDFLSLREGIDTTTPAGRAVCRMAAAFSGLDNAAMAERTAGQL